MNGRIGNLCDGCDDEKQGVLSFRAGSNGGGTKSCEHQTGQGSAVYDCATPQEVGGPSQGCGLPFVRDPGLARDHQLPLGCYQASPMSTAAEVPGTAHTEAQQRSEKALAGHAGGAQKSAEEYRQELAARLKA